ncbi:MAG: antA/AntB antirepressor family protein [Sarcina sp.]
MFLNELIEKKDNGSIYVDARKLHNYLKEESSYKFVHWLKQFLLKEKYGFVENTDFVKCAKCSTIENTNIKQERIEYELTLNTAKELAMLSGMKKGKEVRNYFIKCEEELMETRINNIKAMTMLFTHKDKINFTKETLYPILDSLGVLSKSKKRVHQIIKQSLIGKYENIKMDKEFDTQDFIKDYRLLAGKLKEEYSSYFVDKNQITIFDILEECKG